MTKCQIHEVKNTYCYKCVDDAVLAENRRALVISVILVLIVSIAVAIVGLTTGFFQITFGETKPSLENEWVCIETTNMTTSFSSTDIPSLANNGCKLIERRNTITSYGDPIWTCDKTEEVCTKMEMMKKKLSLPQKEGDKK